MPFQSEKQRRYMHANLPDIAKRWERDYSNGGIAELNAELNSLPEYYLPKNQGGRIGYAHGVHGKGPIKIWGKSIKEQWSTLNQNQKDYIKDHFPDQVPTEGNAQGGLIPSHEAGIYGLAEGGQLVKPGPGRPGYGGPHETEQAGRDYADTSPSDVGSGGADEPSWEGGGYDQPTTPKDSLGGDDEPSWGGEGYDQPTITDDRDDIRHQKDSSGF